jgi:Na/Pi-cotransporter
MGTMVLLDLMGGVALLLWGLHMVHSGILRAFGPDLRSLLAKGLSNRFTAFAAGLGLTALLQSSTATALITSSFTSKGLVSLVPALAIMLGANVGTTLIVQILSFNIAAVAPVLFIIGLVAFRSGPRSRIKDVGRVSIGLGLILLALHILLDTLAPAENAPGARVFMNAITGDPVLCIIFAAVVTWVVHSSVASVLLVMSLAYAHFISPTAALALVLGANLGSAINPIFEGARRDDPASYRLPLGNLINRLAGILLVVHSSARSPICCLMAAGPRQGDGPIPHRVQRRDRHCLHRPARRLGTVAEEAAANARPGDRSVATALSRRERAGDAVAGSGRCCARDVAHGRPRRGHAAQGDGGDDDQRSRAGRSGLADGQQRRQPR